MGHDTQADNCCIKQFCGMKINYTTETEIDNLLAKQSTIFNWYQLHFLQSHSLDFKKLIAAAIWVSLWWTIQWSLWHNSIVSEQSSIEMYSFSNASICLSTCATSVPEFVSSATNFQIDGCKNQKVAVYILLMAPHVFHLDLCNLSPN